jgi:raffinose/stachyose/melibiose transport system substrate-binding protein
VLPAISYKNKVYGITFPGAKIWVFFYNKDIFAKLGLKPPTNYAEFKAVAAKIKASGVTPVFEALQNGWHQVLPLFESGPYYQGFYPDLYNKLNANTFNIKNITQLKTIITQIKEFADLGYYGKDFASNSVEGDYKAIADGKAAMVLEGIGWGAQLENDFPAMKGKMGIFVMPWGDNQIIGINPASNAYFGNVKSKNQKEILQFFAFLARHDNLVKRMNGDPQALSICWPEVTNKYPKEYSDYIKAHKTGTVMQAAVKYIDSQWMDVGKDLEGMYAGAFTVDQVMQTIASRRDEQAKLQKDPAWAK